MKEPALADESLPGWIAKNDTARRHCRIHWSLTCTRRTRNLPICSTGFWSRPRHM